MRGQRYPVVAGCFLFFSPVFGMTTNWLVALVASSRGSLYKYQVALLVEMCRCASS